MSNEQLVGPMTLNKKKGEVICIAGEAEYDLFIIHSGKLLICVNNGRQITPLAYLAEGEYLGELSFFDKKSRSAHVICLEDTSLIQIPVTEIDLQFPEWLSRMAKDITAKLRHSDEIIGKKGIRKKNVESIKPLSIEEQREIYQTIEKEAEIRGLSL
jgi:CRP-like cAMP-binding protein